MVLGKKKSLWAEDCPLLSFLKLGNELKVTLIQCPYMIIQRKNKQKVLKEAKHWYAVYIQVSG